METNTSLPATLRSTERTKYVLTRGKKLFCQHPRHGYFYWSTSASNLYFFNTFEEAESQRTSCNALLVGLVTRATTTKKVVIRSNVIMEPA